MPAVAAWFAVPAQDPRVVARTLGLRTVLPANWSAGFAEIERVGAFVAPPVDGWVLVVGPDIARAAADVVRLEKALALLGEAFGEACWFTTDEKGERHGWARAVGRALLRGYAYDGERGHVWSEGDVSDAERALGCFVDDPRDRSDDDVKWWPDRSTVLALAGAWSIDPARLAAAHRARGVGCVGRL